MVQTVTGMVPVESVRLADGHAHLWIKPPPGADAVDAPELTDYDAILAELEDFRAAGGTTLIDCQPGGCGRDGRMLVQFAQATGLQIVAVTGFHLRKYYPARSWIWGASELEAAEFFLQELNHGLTETGGTALAGCIKVAFDGSLEGAARPLLEAAAEAARLSGSALLCHTEMGENAEVLPGFFNDRGLVPDRLYCCHLDKRPDVGLHRELAQAGVLLGYDTFLRAPYQPETRLWPLLLEMVREGLGSQIALGLDMARDSLWAHMGGEWGLLALPQLIVPRLRAEGVAESVIAGLTGQNVARRLQRQPVA